MNTSKQLNDALVNKTITHIKVNSEPFRLSSISLFTNEGTEIYIYPGARRLHGNDSLGCWVESKKKRS